MPTAEERLTHLVKGITDAIKQGAEMVYFHPRSCYLKYVCDQEFKSMEVYCGDMERETWPPSIEKNLRELFLEVIQLDENHQLVLTPDGWLKRYVQTEVYPANDFSEVYAPVNPEIIPPLRLPHPKQAISMVCNLRKGLVIISGHGRSGRTSTAMSLISERARMGKSALCVLNTPPLHMQDVVHDVVEANAGVIVKQVFTSNPAGISKFLDWPCETIFVDFAIKSGPDLDRLLTLAESKLVIILGDALVAADAVEQLIHSQSRYDSLTRERVSRQLKAVLTQALVPVIYDDHLSLCPDDRCIRLDKIAVGETLLATHKISQLIEENKSWRLAQEISINHAANMTLFDDDLTRLYCDRVISAETFIDYAIDSDKAKRFVESNPLDKQ